jgi:hypothetical protein
MQEAEVPSQNVGTDPRNTTQKVRVQCRQDFIVQNLQTFYNDPGNLEKITPILKGESPISLRLVDWFITNYAKKNNTSYMMGTKQFLVHFNYKRELKAYSKKLFDPFCRRDRIMFEALNQASIMTTVGQLNFFRWFIEKKILDFIEDNRTAIEADMNASIKEHYSKDGKKLQSGRRQRTELSRSAMKVVNQHEMNVIVSFD